MRLITLILVLLLSTAVAAAQQSRHFLFTYGAAVTGLEPGQQADIWVPIAPTDRDQQVAVTRHDLPGEHKLVTDTRYGNTILYIKANADSAGKIPLSITYDVTRYEAHATKPDPNNVAKEALYLQPDALVPIDGKPLKLLEGHPLPEDPAAKARVIYDVVLGSMTYKKEGTGWGRGDANWACDSHYGNCSDFHSLFISLARSQKIPAMFEIGFGLPETPGRGEISGYHCWARFQTPHGSWVPVDISEASKAPSMKEYYFGNLTSNRILFSVGRDLIFVPKQQGSPVNFLIYPYTEVGGTPWPDNKVEHHFWFQDIEQPQQAAR